MYFSLNYLLNEHVYKKIALNPLKGLYKRIMHRSHFEHATLLYLTRLRFLGCQLGSFAVNA